MFHNHMAPVLILTAD